METADHAATRPGHGVAGSARPRRLLGAFALALLLSACTPQLRNHGYAPSDEELSAIKISRDTRETVAEAIGPPTTEGVLNDRAWYYVESRFRQYAWQAPHEIAREVVVISFDGKGRVSNIERFGLEDGHIVTISRRVTEGSAARAPFLQRVFGRLGLAQFTR